MGNQHAPKTIVAAIRQDTLKGLPVQVLVPSGIGGLGKNSVVDCGVLSTVDKETLGERIGHLPQKFMDEVECALKISLSLK